jgi:hypothetical protein
MLAIKIKRPGDSLDYDIDYTDWITDSDTITSVTTAVVESGELSVDSVQISSPVVKVWLSGGVDGTSYHVEVTAVTSGGRVKEECFKIRVRDC